MVTGELPHKDCHLGSFLHSRRDWGNIAQPGVWDSHGWCTAHVCLLDLSRCLGENSKGELLPSSESMSIDISPNCNFEGDIHVSTTFAPGEIVVKCTGNVENGWWMVKNDNISGLPGRVTSHIPTCTMRHVSWAFRTNPWRN
jgi:hypothetical protein